MRLQLIPLLPDPVPLLIALSSLLLGWVTGGESIHAAQLPGIGSVETKLASFSDLRPQDWAYQSLATLQYRYGCVAGLAAGTFEGQRPLSRFEAAALLNACLDRLTEATDEVKALVEDLSPELAQIRARADGLGARVGALEATGFSTTTKLNGLATFVVGSNAFTGSNRPVVNRAQGLEGGASLNFDMRLSLDTSFTGKDLLRAQLRAGNFLDSASGDGGGLNQLEVAFQENCGQNVDCEDVLAVYRLFYQVPLGRELTLTIGGRVRQDDMLAIWPSVYPAETILDTFTYTGAAGAYNTNIGAGAGLWWKRNGWSLSAQYIASNGEISIGTAQAGETGTLQLGYVSPDSSWAAAAVYTYSQGIPGGVYPGSATPLAALNTTVDPGLGAFGLDGVSHSVGLSGYWQPATSSWLPSVSAGWGINRVHPGQGGAGFDPLTTQSWTVGLQLKDAFARGNTAGLAMGQPTFVTACGNSCFLLLGPNQSKPRDHVFALESWYRIAISDGISITPALFYLSNPYGQLNSVLGNQYGLQHPTFNNFGILLKTSLRF